MSGEPWQKHVRILAFDLKGYSALKDHEKNTAQKQLHACRDRCTPNGTLQIGGNLGGDGGMIFFDGPAGCNLDAVALFREQMQGLGLDLPTVRFALHDGEVIWNGEDYAGGAVDLVMDLLNGMPRQPAGLVVASKDVAHTLEQQRAGMEGSLVRLIDVGVKTRSREAWAVTRNTEFENAEQAHEIGGFFGPRPWCFQQSDKPFDEDETRVFLETLPSFVPAGFAARAALRLVPVLVGGVDITRKAMDTIIAPCLYATAPPWLAGTGPNLSGDVRSVAATATAADAADAAATAAYAADAADAADAAATAACVSDADAATGTCAGDADLRSLLDAGGDPVKMGQVLIGSLWPGAEPDTFSKLCTNMRQILRADDPSWSVWLDWYDERLRGAAPDPGRELARATALTEDDYKNGAVHMNRRVMAALEEYERGRSPTPGQLDISRDEERIVRKPTPSVGTPTMPDVDDAEFFGKLGQQIDSISRDIVDPGASNQLSFFRQAFGYMRSPLNGCDDPGDWLVSFRTFRSEVFHLQQELEMDRLPQPVSMLLQRLQNYDRLICDRFPDEAAVQNASINQHPHAPSEDSAEALKQVLDAATDTLSDELNRMFGELLAEIPKVPVEPSSSIETEPLTVKQRDTLYRLKALTLRVKELVDQPREKLMNALGAAQKGAEVVDKFVRVSEKFKEVWDKISSFLLGG